MSKAATMEIPINSNGDTGTLAEDDSLEQVGHTACWIWWLCGTSWDHPMLLFTYLKLLHKVCVYLVAMPKLPKDHLHTLSQNPAQSCSFFILICLLGIPSYCIFH